MCKAREFGLVGAQDRESGGLGSISRSVRECCLVVRVGSQDSWDLDPDLRQATGNGECWVLYPELEGSVH